MSGSKLWAGVVIVMYWLFAAASGRAEDTGVRATIGQPAVLVATPRLTAAPGGSTPQIVVAVVGYSPASDGPVQAVVTTQTTGSEREIGHISIFPRTAFDASQPEKTQRFAFPLPEGVAANAPLNLTITVKPSAGTGRGSSFVLGSAKIE